MIEYLAPSSGGSLSFPIKQVQFNLTNGDLQKLNSSPFELISSGKYNVVLQAAIYFKVNNVNSGFNIFIGFEPLLNVEINSYYCYYNTSFMVPTLSSQFFATGIRAINTWIDSSVNSSPLVLWQQADDGSADFDFFRILITYIEYPV